MILLNKCLKFFFIFISNCTPLVILLLIWKKRFNFILLIAIAIFLFIIFLFLDFKNTNIDHKGYNECLTPLNHDHENLQHLTTSRSYNVFFLETNNEGTKFGTKQLCSIESATKANPNAQVFVMSVNARFNLNEANLCDKYSNLIQIKLDLVELFRDTELLDWWSSGKVLNSTHRATHISNAGRYAVLYKYGGFYSDLDTISLKSFAPLRHKSGPGYSYEHHDEVGSAVLHFVKKHPFLKYIFKEYRLVYNPEKRLGNGPILIKKSLKSYCKFENIFEKLMNGSLDEDHKCKDLIIFPREYFFPYTYTGELEKLFEKNTHINTARLKDSYSVHFFGFLTKKYEVGINDNSLYEYLAAQYCPNVYEYVKNNGIKFS